jgi:hypothetical protein
MKECLKINVFFFFILKVHGIYHILIYIGYCFELTDIGVYCDITWPLLNARYSQQKKRYQVTMVTSYQS